MGVDLVKSENKAIITGSDNTSTVSPKENDPYGNFSWELRKNPNQKLKTLHLLGVLPDCGILSNKLINVFSHRVLKIMMQVSDSQAENDNDRIGIEPNKLMLDGTLKIDMALNLHVSEAIRAVQKIDLLPNRNAQFFSSNYEEIIEEAIGNLGTLKVKLTAKKDSLKNLIDLISIRHRRILGREIALLEEEIENLTSLKTVLESDKDKKQYVRNGDLIQWQRGFFKNLIEKFRINQRDLNREHFHESTSNTETYHNASLILGSFIGQAHTPYSKEDLWITTYAASDKVVLDSTDLTSSARERNNLLAAIQVAEKMSASSEQGDDSDFQLTTQAVKPISADIKKIRTDCKAKSKKYRQTLTAWALFKLAFFGKTDGNEHVELPKTSHIAYQTFFYRFLSFFWPKKMGDVIRDAQTEIRQKILSQKIQS